MNITEIYMIGAMTSVIYCCVRTAASFKKINNPNIKEESYDKLTKQYAEISKMKSPLGERAVAIAGTVGVLVFSVLWFIIIPCNIYRGFMKWKKLGKR